MSPSRLFWFAVGGASAFWWIRKHDEERFGRFSGKLGEDGRWHCMKHSWGRRSEIQDKPAADGQVDKDIEAWKQEAKERVSLVKSNNPLPILT
jgi:hypothetical protein